MISKADARNFPTGLLAVLFVLFAALPIHAQDDFVYWPNADYDPTIPTIEETLGYTPGERITWHADAIEYFQVLAAAQPGRVVLQEYARSWQGRELVYAVISSPENIARLDDIKSNMQRLADPRLTDEDDASTIIAAQPAITWLSYGVHGNEISSTDAAMLTAYHLLASRGDDRVEQIMRDTVVVIDPMQNPDGRDRFIHAFTSAEGIRPDSDRISAEHDEPWPGGRTNHYLFDMNRDWFIQTQPETQGRTAAMLEYFPVAYVDAHEMGSDGTYFFAPEAIPFNPHLAEDQRNSLQLFGRNNARYFDQFGVDYFTREVYDAFYPGYGASWPSYFGSVAMTYEQASARGLVFRQYDGNDLHYRYTVRNHFITSLATAETVQVNREKLLTDFYNYRASAIEEGQEENIRAYIIPVQADQDAADKIAGLLGRQGVEVDRALTSFSACGNSYDSGSYVIRTDQPAKRFIRTLLDVNVPMEEDFLVEQERRRSENLPDEIYDVTAWSLPLMFNIEADTCNRAPAGEFVRHGTDLIQAGSVIGGEASVSYIVPWGEASAVRLLSEALQRGLTVKSNDKAFTNVGNEYPAGSLILDVADNPADIFQQLSAIAAQTGAEVVAVNDSWVTEGPSFGSANVVRFNAPRVAMAWDEPTTAYSAGNTRFVIERQFGYPVTPIRVDRLRSADLRHYQVLILPLMSGRGYESALGASGIENLKTWVEQGGVVVALGNATQFLSDPDVDLLSIRRERAVVEVEAPEEEQADEATVEGSYLTSNEEYEDRVVALEDSPDSVAGVLVRADVHPEHWLSAGVAPVLNVLVRGTEIYTPIRINDGVNVARFQGPDELLASGYIWDENRRQLAYKPFVVQESRGAGEVIAFTQDPTVRAYLDGLNVILMNAIFRGSAHARPPR
ncbi:MAG: M14 family metallopeptidase [Proteobacteria bacterium]|nr:M14 family metallopeptidase [Pseudomonadota bacterium]MDA0927519.1 M14 family metallopeptidase [Pseudomonadota bacterium]